MNVTRVTVREQVTAVLRSRIVRRELAPGQAVTEDAIAGEMGVSRPTMRQALAELESEGLLSRTVGNRVLRVTKLTEDDVAQAYRARRVLEFAGIDSVADAPQDRLDEFWQITDEIENAVGSSGLDVQVRSDFKMHESIVDLLDSPELSAVEVRLLTRLRLVSIDVASDAEWQKMIRANRDLCEMISNRRVGDARAALAARLFESERMVVASLSG